MTTTQGTPPRSLRELIKSNRFLVWLLVLALAVPTAGYYALQRGREIDPAALNNSILLFALRNLNVVLILIVAFVLVRNLTKLWIERRRQRLGAKFRTKLILTYIGLSLLPGLVLFLYATELLQGSIDRMFRTDIDDLLEPANQVSQALTSTHQDQLLRDAERLLSETADLDLEDPRGRGSLSRALGETLSSADLDYLAVYRDTTFVHATVNPQTLSEMPEPTRGMLLEAIRTGAARAVDQVSGREERLILGAAATDGADEPTVAVAGRLLDAELAGNTETLIGAYQSRRQLHAQRDEIRAAYWLLFLTVTLCILLVSCWVGLYVAGRVTGPIEALAAGTRRIAGGDLQHRVEAAADDEVQVLVDSFNRMTDALEDSNRDLVATNRRLDAERARIEAVLESGPAGVLSLDRDGRILTCNRAALEMLGLAPDTVLAGSPPEALGELLPDRGIEAVFADLPDATRRRRRPQTTPARREVSLGGKDDWKTLEVKTSPLRAPSGAGGFELLGHVIVIEDLTALLDAQKAATWTEAARRIAHEIKNPLTPIKLAAERMLRKSRNRDRSLDAAVEEGSSVIVREVGNMLNLVDEFARYARMRRPQPRDVDVERLIGETVDLYRELKPGVEVEALIEAGEDGLHVKLDADQMRSALVNLLDNAIAATTPPGQVTVRAGRSNGVFDLSVSDTGSGVPKAAREKLFLPYFSTKGRGSGLGLAIVQRIVSDHNGSIRVEDNQPHGTTFSIELPQ
ncbi:MAG: ATP-binding protein [Acidobacteria bacterium]|nr:ATP-binding protein [Acidobacteriota bacterium]